MQAYTYILSCSDGSFYTGWTYDPVSRLAAHNAGKGAKYTASRRPVRLIHLECFETKNEAMARERQIKKLNRRQKEQLIGPCHIFDKN